MAVKSKAKTVYVCTQCGCEAPKWQGKCPDCGSWNTFVEETRTTGGSAAKAAASERRAAPAKVKPLAEVSADESVRYCTGMKELDRVLGGGIVPGAAILVCGDPGIGKSTILLQMCRTIDPGLRVLYVSGEESLRQVKLRANRLEVAGGTSSLPPPPTPKRSMRPSWRKNRMWWWWIPSRPSLFPPSLPHREA